MIITSRNLGCLQGVDLEWWVMQMAGDPGTGLPAFDDARGAYSFDSALDPLIAAGRQALAEQRMYDAAVAKYQNETVLRRDYHGVHAGNLITACLRQILADDGIIMSEEEVRAALPTFDADWGIDPGDLAEGANTLHPTSLFKGGGVGPGGPRPHSYPLPRSNQTIYGTTLPDRR